MSDKFDTAINLYCRKISWEDKNKMKLKIKRDPWCAYDIGNSVIAMPLLFILIWSWQSQKCLPCLANMII